MNMSIVRSGAKQLSKQLVKGSPVVLTGLAVGGLVTTVILAIRATPKAMEVFYEAEDRARVEFEEFNPDIEVPEQLLSTMDTLKLTWKFYIPTISVGLGTILCIIGANSIHMRRNAALASLYAVTEATLKEYQEKVLETFGKNKELKVRDDIAQDKLNRNPVEKKEVFTQDRGQTLCYDSLSGRYFMSDVDVIKRKQNEYNHQLLTEWSKSLNEFYNDLGLESINMGNNVGWTSDCLLDIHFTAKLCSDGRPCVVLDYKVEPHNI